MRNGIRRGRRSHSGVFVEPIVKFDTVDSFALSYNPDSGLELSPGSNVYFLYTEWYGREVTYDFFDGFTTSDGVRLTREEEDFLTEYMNDSVLEEKYKDWLVANILYYLPSVLEENNLEVYYNKGTYYVLGEDAVIPDDLEDGLELVTDYTEFAWEFANSYVELNG